MNKKTVLTLLAISLVGYYLYRKRKKKMQDPLEAGGGGQDPQKAQELFNQIQNLYSSVPAGSASLPKEVESQVVTLMDKMERSGFTIQNNQVMPL